MKRPRKLRKAPPARKVDRAAVKWIQADDGEGREPLGDDMLDRRPLPTVVEFSARAGRWELRVQRSGEDPDGPYHGELWDNTDAGNCRARFQCDDVGDAMKRLEDLVHTWSTCVGCGKPIGATEPLELVRGAACHAGSHAIAVREMMGANR